jgi:ketosteroid isomerase-like protein
MIMLIRMSILRNIYVAAFTMSILSATAIAATNQPSDAAIVADIRSVIQAQQEAWNRGDIDAFMNGYARSDKTVFVGGDVKRGWQNVLDYYKTKYSDREKMGVLSFADMEVTSVAPDAAMVLMRWELKLEKCESARNDVPAIPQNG